MKIFNIEPLLYTYKLEFGNKIPIDIKFNYHYKNININKKFIASDIIVESSRIIDVTEDNSSSDNTNLDIFIVDKKFSDRLDIKNLDSNREIFICKYSRCEPSNGEILNSIEPLEIRNRFENFTSYEFRIKTVRPDILLDENKIYIPVIMRYPLNSIIFNTKKIPSCYINFYDKEIFVYNPVVLRFYNGDSTNYNKILYPPIFLGPYLKGLILENTKYIEYYKEYRFSLEFTQNLFNHIGYSPVSNYKSMISYRITYIMSKIVKVLLEKYIAEIIFILPHV